MRSNVVQAFAKIGVLAQPDAVDEIAKAPDPEGALAKVLEHLRALQDPPITLTGEDVSALLLPGMGIAEAGALALATTSKASALRPAADVASRFEVLKDPTGESTSEGKLDDFTRYFRDRLSRLRRILRARRESAGAQEIARLKARPGGVRAIGMVGDLKRPSGGGVYFELEDETGSIRCVCGKRGHAPSDLVNDEVVLVTGNIAGSSDPALFVDEVIRPDVPAGVPARRSEEDVAVAFISDIHIGSKTFLTDSWRKFLRWLEGEGSQEDELARNVKYLVISGDLVDGVGVFPNQENNLAIMDLGEQYETLAHDLAGLPDHLEVIIIPGNHDAVRPAEPQPALPSSLRRVFDSNSRFLGNPASFSLHGVDILAYHGRSFDDLVTNIQGMSYRTPLDMMEILLRKRHLAPIYGDKTPLAPEPRDWLVIDEVPDIFVTGHVHLTGARPYKNVTLLHDSAWQSQTEYQRMMNLVPDPGRVPVVNLRTREVSIVQF